MEHLTLNTDLYNYQDYVNALFNKKTTDTSLLEYISKVLESFDKEDKNIKNIFFARIEIEIEKEIEKEKYSDTDEEYFFSDEEYSELDEENNKGCVQFYRRK